MKASTILLLGTAVCAPAVDLQTLHQRQLDWTVGQTVNTSSGPVNGHAGLNASEVSEYLGIPFAQPPVGDLRFAPPQSYNGKSTINGTNFGFSCPGQPPPTPGSNLSPYVNANITIPQGVQILEMWGQISEKFSEDCLTLNVWTRPQTGEAKKAVLLWIHGGGFSSGSSTQSLYNGQNIVQQEDVIVVTINYRVNIFGFPGNPVGPNNLGLLDQRLAVEWVRDNIKAFGGDPSRITLFGQSAGSASVDFYTFAWTTDPIAAGFIPQSGTGISFGLPNQANASATSWFNVTSTLGCGNATSDAEAVISCMRIKTQTEILKAIPLTSSPGLGRFIPTVDEIVIFSDYTARAASGNFAKRPMLIGNTNYEAGWFKTIEAVQGVSYPDAYWDDFNLGFTCPSAARANVSVAAGVPTWLYRYFGEFPNMDIAPGTGAWHTSEIAIIFDTTPSVPPSTTAEISIGKYMRGAWATFAKDPVNGLNNYEGGWPQYDPTKETLIRLAYDNITGTNLAAPELYDAACVSSASGTPTGGSGNSTSTTSAAGTRTATNSAVIATPTTNSTMRVFDSIFNRIFGVFNNSIFIM